MLSWGAPAVLLRCGLAEPAPTAGRAADRPPCLEVDGVDWVLDDARDPMTATSYGRSPAVHLVLPASYGRQSLPAALADVRDVAAALPRTGHACIG